MRQLHNAIWYTMEELVKATGYQKGTLYNLTNAGVLSAPILGLAGSDYPSQGLYKETVLSEIQRYCDLKAGGMRKRDIIELMKAERASNEPQLQVLETRREGYLEAL